MPEETEVDFDLDPIIPAIPVTVNCSAYCCLFPIPSELDGFGAPGEELDIPASELDEFNTLSIEERYVRLKSIQDPEESLNAWREIRNEGLTIQAVNRYEVFWGNQAPSTTNSSRCLRTFGRMWDRSHTTLTRKKTWLSVILALQLRGCLSELRVRMLKTLIRKVVHHTIGSKE